MIKEAMQFLKLQFTPPATIQYSDPLTGDEGQKLVVPDGFQVVDLVRPAHVQFGHIQVSTLDSLLAYLKKFSTGHEALAVFNNTGIRVELNHSSVHMEVKHKPQLREHTVTLPATYAVEDEVAGKEIEATLNKWIPFERMEAFIDKVTHVLALAPVVREALLNLDGTTTTKIRKTSNGSQLAVTSTEDVRGTVDLPRELSFLLNFMGFQIKFSAPLRVRLQNNAIEFFLADIGSLAADKARVTRECASRVAANFPDILIVEGRL